MRSCSDLRSRSRAARCALAALAVLGLLAESAGAHGGIVFPPVTTWDGPKDVLPPVRGPGSPTTGGPGVPSGPSGPTGTPTTGTGRSNTGLDLSIPADAWDPWWMANRPRYLELQKHRRVRAGPTTGGDNEASPAIGEELRARIGALLHRVLGENAKASADEQSAALIAAAKLAWQPAETRALFFAQLRSPVQEVRETAALALGLLGDEGALPALIALLRDGDLARSLTGASSVDDRTRAFAAYAIVLLVRRSEPARAPAAARIARDHLLALLDGSLSSRPELEAAVICALGVLPMSERDAWSHALPRLESLWSDASRSALVRAQVPTAMGRLLRAGTAEKLSIEIEDPRSSWLVRNSAELICGGLGGELAPLSRQRVAASLEIARRRGQAPCERAFAILSLARLEDAAALQVLAREATSGAHLDRPWIALGLGLAARSGAERGADVSALLTALREGYRRTKAAENRGAFAIALGLARDAEAAPLLRRDFATSDVARERGHIAVSLGLLGDAGARALLRAALPRATREPEEIGAIALTLLDDREAVPQLLELLESGRTTAALAPIAEALGRLGGAESAHALLALAEDPKRTDLLHAFAIVGLGLCVEEQELPWVAPFAADFNYLAAPITLYATNGLLAIL